MQFFHEKLAESMSLRDDLLQRCIRMALYGKQGNRKLVNNANMGVIRPTYLGKFAHFRVGRVKLSSIKEHQERLFHQNGV